MPWIELKIKFLFSQGEHYDPQTVHPMRYLETCHASLLSAQSRGVMNVTFKFQWPRMHFPRDRGLRLFLQIAESFQEEFTMEAMAINNMLLSCSDEVRNARVDVQVDNQTVIHT